MSASSVGADVERPRNIRDGSATREEGGHGRLSWRQTEQFSQRRCRSCRTLGIPDEQDSSWYRRAHRFPFRTKWSREDSEWKAARARNCDGTARACVDPTSGVCCSVNQNGQALGYRLIRARQLPLNRSNCSAISEYRLGLMTSVDDRPYGQNIHRIIVGRSQEVQQARKEGAFSYFQPAHAGSESV